MLSKLPEIFDCAIREIAELEDKVKNLEERNKLLEDANKQLSELVAEFQLGD